MKESYSIHTRFMYICPMVAVVQYVGLPEAEQGCESRRGASDVPECSLIWAPVPTMQEQSSKTVEQQDKT